MVKKFFKNLMQISLLATTFYFSSIDYLYAQGISDWFKKAKESITKKKDEYSKKLKEKFEETKESTKRKAHEFKEKATRDWNRTVEKSEKKLDKLLTKENLEKAKKTVKGISRLKKELEITVIKNVPIYDSEDGKWKSFDTFARDLMADCPEAEGSSLAEDPVRSTYLMLTDTNYFLSKAKLIPDDKGNKLTLEEAVNSINLNFNEREEAREAVNNYKIMKRAYENGDGEVYETHQQKLVRNINNINKKRNPSLERYIEKFERGIKLLSPEQALAKGYVMEYNSEKDKQKTYKTTKTETIDTIVTYSILGAIAASIITIITYGIYKSKKENELIEK